MTLTSLGARVWRRAAATTPWTNVYGVARTILAAATLLTLAFSHSTSLFCPASGRPYAVNGAGPAAISFFYLLRDHLELARWLAVSLLALVASGWRPRITGPLHWWIAFSLQASVTMVDGGDQITAVLALLLLPVTLTDSRRWHWMPAEETLDTVSVSRRIVALSALLIIRLQMAGLYFHAAVGKAKVEEWLDGTAVYYWFTDPSFGAPAWLMPILGPVLTSAAGVAMITWGSMVLEFFLAAGLVASRRLWPLLLVAGVAFHVAIATVHGLISFSLAMTAGLILYFRPPEQPFAVRWRWRREPVEMPLPEAAAA